MSHHRISTIPQKNTEYLERDFSRPRKPFAWKWSCRYYLFYPCGRLTECESSKVKTVLIFCLVLNVSSPWCRSSWQNWPSGRESRQQAKAWTSWALPSLPRTESGKKPTCWWETCFHLHTYHTTTGVQELEDILYFIRHQYWNVLPTSLTSTHLWLLFQSLFFIVMKSEGVPSSPFCSLFTFTDPSWTVWLWFASQV